MKVKILLLLLFFLSFSYLNSTVVLTHGALARDDSWYKTGGAFFEVLKKQAANLGHETISFSWDQSLGGITHFERLKAGVELSKIILNLTKYGEKKIILIGHSYGGHVIKAASQLLDDFIDDFSIYGVDNSITYSLQIRSEEGLEKLELQSAFLEAQKEVREYKEKLELQDRKQEKDYFIDTVYTIGTPNDIPDYVANMNVIGYLYNFYSKGDVVQEIFGDVLLPEPKHERSVNLSIQIKNDGWFGFGLPNHSEIHAEIIAEWILHIPFNLINRRIGNFQEFSFDKTGNILFARNNVPIYSILTETEEVGIVSQVWNWFVGWAGLTNYIW